MTWLGLLLVGVAVTDLFFSLRPSRYLPEAVGVTAVVLLATLAGLGEYHDIAAVLAICCAVIGWGLSVTWGFGQHQPWLPLTVLGGSLLAVLLLAGYAGPGGGALGHWLGATPLPAVGDLAVGQALPLLGGLLVQLSTGNVVVRLVLEATGSRNPSKVVPRPDHGQGDEPTLKGGRLIGPMERLLILCLGLAGQFTAAGIVIAAKGLLRFPELQAARDEAKADPEAPTIHEVTEYFLVGSFVSWLVALGALVVVV